jgi:hypothetical protein
LSDNAVSGLSGNAVSGLSGNAVSGLSDQIRLRESLLIMRFPG